MGAEVEAGLRLVEHRRRRLAGLEGQLFLWHQPLHVADEEGPVELRLPRGRARPVRHRHRGEREQREEQHHFVFLAGGFEGFAAAFTAAFGAGFAGAGFPAAGAGAAEGTGGREASSRRALASRTTSVSLG